MLSLLILMTRNRIRCWKKEKYLITGGTLDVLWVCKVLFFEHVTNLIGRVSPAEALIPSNTLKF